LAPILAKRGSKVKRMTSHHEQCYTDRDDPYKRCRSFSDAPRVAPAKMTREERDKILFNRIAGKYARKDSRPSSALARRSKLVSILKPVLAMRPNLGTLVDVGCGVGGPAKYLAGNYERYIGIDHSEELIAAAKTFNLGNPRAEFVVASVKSQDLPRNVADVILADGALHHMSELAAVMASLARIAKPGALVVAIEPQDANPFLRGMRRLRGFLDPTYSREQICFSRDDLRDLFSSAGITDLSFAYQGFFSTPFAEVVMAPQALAVPCSRLAISLDLWLQKNWPAAMKRISFNIVVTGRFPE
jgi:SAM-dependent methyltransferase